MSLQLWLAFVLSASVMLIIPGPTIVYVVAVGLTRGRAAAMSTVQGVVAGDFVAMVLSLLGVGTVLLVSSTLFSMIKLAGAAYLVWIGVSLWRFAPGLTSLADDVRTADIDHPSMQAFLVTVLNPKSILFFVAFMSQFVDAGRPVIPQFLVLGVTFLILAGINIAGYAWLSGSVAKRITPSARCRFQRGGAICLMTAGLWAIWDEGMAVVRPSV